MKIVNSHKHLIVDLFSDPFSLVGNNDMRQPANEDFLLQYFVIKLLASYNYRNLWRKCLTNTTISISLHQL